jgi:glutamate 5-kinase
MPRKKLISKVKSIVVKVGTSTITEEGSLSTERIASIVSNVCELKRRGYKVVIVSSGAISAGASVMKKKKDSLTIPEKQAMASIGQALLIDEYRRLFMREGYCVGQILLTEDDVKHRRRFLNARNTLEKLLELDVVPVVNENDSVVVKEIKFGDNDTLSAHVAGLINAHLLILLSDIDGFYWNMDDPEPVEEIHRITEEVLSRCGDAGSEYGTGGMITKMRAADIMLRFGEQLIIARGTDRDVLLKIMAGEKVGTIFTGSSRPLSSRKKWLAARSPKGAVVIDDGAVEAVVGRKKSLLASGIVGVSGMFDMGDIVEIVSVSRKKVGKGVVKYYHVEMDQVKGKSTREIEKMLGIRFYDEAIHRDDMIVYD